MPESSALPLMCPFGWYAADSAIFRFGHPIYGTRSAAHPIPWHTRNAGPRQRQVLLDRNKGIEVSHDYSGRVSSGGIARFITNFWHHSSFPALGPVAPAALVTIHIPSLRLGVAMYSQLERNLNQSRPWDLLRS